MTIALRCSLLLVALTLAPAMAHLFEMTSKLALDRDDYLTVQQIYRGWALLGLIVIPALLATLALAVACRRHRRMLGLASTAFLCLAAAHAVFWGLTFPVNQATANWTTMPEDWVALRRQWEWSHATGAVLTLAAFVALVMMTRSGPVERRPVADRSLPGS